MKTPAIWRNLLDFFQSNEKLEDKHLHMSVIKIYTLLNLASKQKIIPTSSLSYNQALPHKTCQQNKGKILTPTQLRINFFKLSVILGKYFNFDESENYNEDTEEEEEEDDELKERESFSEEAESDDNSDDESSSRSEVNGEISNPTAGQEDIEL